MNKLVFYPAIFHKAEEGGFWISFPDLPECLTEGNDMTQAYEMAVNALGLALTSREIENEPIPEPSAPSITQFNYAYINAVQLPAYGSSGSLV